MRDIEITTNSELKIDGVPVGSVTWSSPFGISLHAPFCGTSDEVCENCARIEEEREEVESDLYDLRDRHAQTLAELAALKAKLAEVQKS